MLDPFTLEMLLRQRREDDLKRAAIQRQVRAARSAAGRPAVPGVSTRPGLGDRLVRRWLALRTAGSAATHFVAVRSRVGCRPADRAIDAGR